MGNHPSGHRHVIIHPSSLNLGLHHGYEGQGKRKERFANGNQRHLMKFLQWVRDEWNAHADIYPTVLFVANDQQFLTMLGQALQNERSQEVKWISGNGDALVHQRLSDKVDQCHSQRIIPLVMAHHTPSRVQKRLRQLIGDLGECDLVRVHTPAYLRAVNHNGKSAKMPTVQHIFNLFMAPGMATAHLPQSVNTPAEEPRVA